MKMATVDTTSLIKSLNKQALSQFLHESVDDLIGIKKGSLDSIGNDIEWQKENYETARKYVQNIFQNAVVLSEIPISSSLTDFSEEQATMFIDCFDIRKAEILNNIIRNNLSQSDTPIVMDFDWKLKWIIGSASLASIREPVLQVDLHCSDHQINTRSTINFEMNTKELDEFIAELEKLKSWQGS